MLACSIRDIACKPAVAVEPLANISFNPHRAMFDIETGKCWRGKRDDALGCFEFLHHASGHATTHYKLHALPLPLLPEG